MNVKAAVETTITKRTGAGRDSWIGARKSIEILIQRTGEVQIEAVGFKGNACEKATAAFEAALSAIKARRKKPA